MEWILLGMAVWNIIFDFEPVQIELQFQPQIWITATYHEDKIIKQ